MMKWISVKDKLPKDHDRVLCYGYGGGIYACIYNTGENGGTTGMQKGFFPISHTISNTPVATKYWMELPERPAKIKINSA